MSPEQLFDKIGPLFSRARTRTKVDDRGDEIMYSSLTFNGYTVSAKQPCYFEPDAERSITIRMPERVSLYQRGEGEWQWRKEPTKAQLTRLMLLL